MRLSDWIASLLSYQTSCQSLSTFFFTTFVTEFPVTSLFLDKHKANALVCCRWSTFYHLCFFSRASSNLFWNELCRTRNTSMLLTYPVQAWQKAFFVIDSWRSYLSGSLWGFLTFLHKFFNFMRCNYTHQFKLQSLFEPLASPFLNHGLCVKVMINIVYNDYLFLLKS